MNYIQTYDGFKSFFKNIVDKHKNNFYVTNWSDEEAKILKNFNFKLDENKGVFISQLENIKLTVTRYLEEVTVGHAERYYTLNDNKKNIRCEDFETIVKHIKQRIPKEEIEAYKFNL